VSHHQGRTHRLTGSEGTHRGHELSKYADGSTSRRRRSMIHRGHTVSPKAAPCQPAQRAAEHAAGQNGPRRSPCRRKCGWSCTAWRAPRSHHRLPVDTPTTAARLGPGRPPTGSRRLIAPTMVKEYIEYYGKHRHTSSTSSRRRGSRWSLRAGPDGASPRIRGGPSLQVHRRRR